MLEDPRDDASPPLAALIDVGHPAAVPGEYIVVFSDGASADGIAHTLGEVRDLGAQIAASYSVISGFAGRLAPAQIEWLRANPDVAYIEANKYVSIDRIYTNPPHGLDRIDQRYGRNSQFDDRGYDGAGVHVYILDTGIRTTHNELAGRIGAGFSALDGDPSVQDCHGHGTHVASTAAGTRYGVAKKAIVHAVRVLGCDGYGTYADVIEGMDWVRGHGAAFPSVVNMSLGGPTSDAVDTAVRNLTDAGVPVVVSAGNSNSDACDFSPAGAPSAITVGATGAAEVRASFSNIGRCLDLFAPGVDVRAADIAHDSATALRSGTSMAAPHVAGAIAAYLQRFPLAFVPAVGLAVTGIATPSIVGDPRGSPNRFLYTNFSLLGPYQQLSLNTGTALHPTDATFTFAVARNRDLFVIKKSATGTGSTEVHVLSAASGYQQFSLHTGTPLHATDGKFELEVAENRDVFVIKKSGTGTGSTEIHVLSAASGYQQFSLHTGTPLHLTDETFDFAVASNRDVFAIKKSGTGTGSTEVHVLSAASGYQQFSLHTGTALHPTDGTFEFEVARNRDVLAIKKSGTGTDTTEVHVLSAASGYQRFSLHTGTALHPTDATFDFAVAENRDVFAIKKSGTGTGTTEVHVLAN